MVGVTTRYTGRPKLEPCLHPTAKLLSSPDVKPMHFSPERLSSPHRQWPWKKWFGKDSSALPLEKQLPEDPTDGIRRKRSKNSIPGLPRPGTFRRQQSELRENLEPVKTHDRRAFSVDPHRGESLRNSSRTSVSPLPRTSAPGLLGINDSSDVVQEEPETITKVAEPEPLVEDSAEPPPFFNDVFDDDLDEELEKSWILNLSMHFKDRSNREKFFVTYAETPTRWRRVTVSVDYRDASPNSLELELQHTQYQRDKSAKIYEAIRDSLPDIQFYDTVTNLKLATEHERLHVHVTEDTNEVIHFPSVTSIGHLDCLRVKERDVEFDSHLSGFVYKVNVNGQVFIKKEIPGPDTVEEFLYEVNALHNLAHSDSVIKFGGVITDNEGRRVQGLLISYAEKGALIDVLYDGRGQLSWPLRERWAKHIVQGLSEIHEAGFVQGDFTLSNIVIDGDDKAKIIDINRRGCPVGWEPPEVAALIESKQRISMYIGVKSDIFQLGMVLWAIAMQQDEPDIQPRPLTLDSANAEVPRYYRDLVRICLSDDPKDRRNTSYLLDMFPELEDGPLRAQHDGVPGVDEHQYIDPATAVERDDIERFRRLASPAAEHANMDITSTGSHTYVNPPTDISGEAYFFPTRGRSTTRLPVEDIEHRHLSQVSPLDMGDTTDAEDLLSPEGEPIVVDVSPERHYLDDREEPSATDVTGATAQETSAQEATKEDDDMSIDLNDDARRSIEEYRHHHEELEEYLASPEFLTDHVYQPPAAGFNYWQPRDEDVSFMTPSRSITGHDLESKQSYTDMGETTYLDPTTTVDEQHDCFGQALPTVLQDEENDFVTPLAEVAETAPKLDEPTKEMLQPEKVAATVSDVITGHSGQDDSVAPTTSVPAVDEAATTTSTQPWENSPISILGAGEEEPALEMTIAEQACQCDVTESLSSGWVEEAAPQQTTSDLEPSQTSEGEPLVQRQTHGEATKEATKAIEEAAEATAMHPPVNKVPSSTQNVRSEPEWEPKTFTAEDSDDYRMKPVDGRVDSGFATHSDPDITQYETSI